MTKSGVNFIPMVIYCPDRWRYAFDGQKLEIVEEFDEIPEEAVETTKNLMETAGFEVKQVGNRLSMEAHIKPEEALRFLLGEAVSQATTQGLIPSRLQLAVYEELKQPLSLPLPSVPIDI